MAAASYITDDELFGYMPEGYIRNLLRRSDSDTVAALGEDLSAAHQAILDVVKLWAAETIDSFLRNVYTTPLASAGEIVKELNARLVRFKLEDRHASGAGGHTEEWKALETELTELKRLDADRILESARSGQLLPSTVRIGESDDRIGNTSFDEGGQWDVPLAERNL